MGIFLSLFTCGLDETLLSGLKETAIKPNFLYFFPLDIQFKKVTF